MGWGLGLMQSAKETGALIHEFGGSYQHRRHLTDIDVTLLVSAQIGFAILKITSDAFDA
jgi:hypothetical protein